MDFKGIQSTAAVKYFHLSWFDECRMDLVIQIVVPNVHEYDVPWLSFRMAETQLGRFCKTVTDL